MHYAVTKVPTKPLCFICLILIKILSNQQNIAILQVIFVPQEFKIDAEERYCVCSKIIQPLQTVSNIKKESVLFISPEGIIYKNLIRLVSDEC